MKNVIIDKSDHLHQKSTYIDNLVEKYDELLEVKNELVNYLKTEEKAFGISAIQFGSTLPIFAMRLNNEIENFINPILIKGEGVHMSQEGCMSFPEILTYVPRYLKIDVTYKRFNHKNEIKEYPRKLKDFPAFGFQHELDHLFGITLLDKAVPLQGEAEEIDHNKIIKVFRVENIPVGENKIVDYYVDGEDKFIFSGSPVILSYDDEDGKKIPLVNTFCGFKIKGA